MLTVLKTADICHVFFKCMGLHRKVKLSLFFHLTKEWEYQYLIHYILCPPSQVLPQYTGISQVTFSEWDTDTNLCFVLGAELNVLFLSFHWRMLNFLLLSCEPEIGILLAA
jgi:hypothetical protein